MDIKKLESVLKAVENSGTNTIKIESKNLKIKMSCSKGLTPGKSRSAKKDAVDGEASKSSPALGIKTFEHLPESVFSSQGTNANGANDLCSHTVGFFSRFNSASKKQYVKLRDVVKKGDVIGVVKSMHVDHEIKADKSGKIVEFLVEEGQPVEYMQPLMRLGE